MVSKCSKLTLACATIMVAGSVAGADETRFAATKNIAGFSSQPSTFRSVMPLRDGASIFGTGLPRCECEGWDNGTWDQNDGQVSHLGETFAAIAADDFHLCEGQVHDLKSVSGFLITNSNPALRKAKALLYKDCNGCPSGDPIYTFTEFTANEVANLGNGFYLIEYTFVMANQNEEEEQNIVLRGGCYWFALVGKTDRQCLTMNMCDVSFFATTGDGVIKGAVAKKIDGIVTVFNGQLQYSFPGHWHSLDGECDCVGCTDLAFTICADPCKILLTTGTDNRMSGSLSQDSSNPATNTRSADDFAVNPCDNFIVCYIEGCIYTNCEGHHFFFEIYDNDCNLPAYMLGDTLASDRRGYATKATYLGYDVQINGKQLGAYKVEFHDLNILLPKGHQYWLSIGAVDTFSFNERAYFCHNYDCNRPDCLIRFNSGVFVDSTTISNHPLTPRGWVSVGHDFTFCIAGRYEHECDKNGTGGGASVACVADANGSGTVEVADIFTFLNAWFAGCP